MQLNDSTVNGNLNVTEDVQIGEISVTEELAKLNSKLSHIGMIIHSTTLDTMEKVVAIYGGTTWEKIEGMFLLGASSNYTVNSIGGEETHTLTVAEIPTHNHNLYGGNTFTTNTLANAEYESNGWIPNLSKNWSVNNAILDTGANQPHNNMPPYKAVYIWERIE